MRNLLFTIQYQGSRYHGFQVQNNAVTVAQIFQDALEQVTGQRSDIKGCSRTDSGVHANMFCVSVKTESKIPCQNLVRAFNVKLPPDISVLGCREVPLEFHARYSCQGKRYIYKIHNSPIRDAFSHQLVYEYPYPLDAELLNCQAQDFVGTYDFSSFCAAKTSVKDTVRTITACGVERQGDSVTFFVEGDGFLYNMVRIMVGTLLQIGAGGLPQGSIPKIIGAKSRSAAGPTAPPWGLYLDKVFYPQNQLGLPGEEQANG